MRTDRRRGHGHAELSGGQYAEGQRHTDQPCQAVDENGSEAERNAEQYQGGVRPEVPDIQGCAEPDEERARRILR